MIEKRDVIRVWSADRGSWLLGVPSGDPADGGRVWVYYSDLCAAFPGFREIYTPEPDDPPQGPGEDQ